MAEWSVCGIVAEYNPFHRGHQYHISQTRAGLGEDAAIVCVMSGNFVQRGEPAIYEKRVRAEAAVRCGADLVLELPLPWAMASAQTFAHGAVSVLMSTGVVTRLSFGSESGDRAALEETARILLRPELDGMIRTALNTGVSYAAARQSAAEKLAGRPLSALAAPNDILGIEYLKELFYVNSNIVPLTVPRAGAGHDAPGEGDYPSASWLRQKLSAGETIGDSVPAGAAAVYVRETPLFPRELERALLSRLRMLPEEAFSALPDAAEGLDRRLCRAAREEPTIRDVLAAAKTKRYAESRIRRMLWGAALGLTRADSAGTPPYLRVLAANARGRELLAQMRETATLPILTKPASVRDLGDRARHIFELEAAATDFYALAAPDPEARRGGREWRSGPVLT